MAPPVQGLLAGLRTPCGRPATYVRVGPVTRVALPGAGAALGPYLPRLGLQWCAETPEETWRAVDGTLVFADVSGFTSLSERLARRGRIGAEELTEVLDAAFSRLLAVAYDDDGSLIKFGGDALVLLFSGPAHALRACRSAMGMRTTMRRMGALHTSVGQVRLRMSVGIHSGLLHFFRVGHSHRELLVAGPAATETVTMEAAADAGEILVSASTAAAVEARWLGAPKGPGRLLRNLRLDVVDLRPRPVPPYLGADVTEAIPLALRSHLLGGEVEPEHRNASVAFIHYGGVDALLERAGPAAVAGALDDLIRIVQRAADDEQVTFLTTDIDRDGGKVVLATGVPLALGDDEGRILRALGRIAAGSPPLPVRIGVNSGAVFAGAVGPQYRRTYTVMGDEVNLAARLMAAAAPGQVLATRGVVERSRTAFELQPLPPLTVKGKAAPVRAFAVGTARIGGPHGPDPVKSRMPFVGRTSELQVLSEVVEAARGGSGGMVAVSGDPGIGKSRLVAEARHLAADMAVVRVACESYEASTPYYVVANLMADVLGIPPGAGRDAAGRVLSTEVSSRAPALSPWVPLLAGPLNLDVPDTPETARIEVRSRRHRTNEVAVELLAQVLASPTLLIFEDVHWMDEASASLLHHLGREVEARPWAVVVTRREGGGGFTPDVSEGGRAITLAPLDAREATALAAAVTDENPLRPHEVDEVVERSGGNPLFLEGLLRSAAADDALPDTVDAVVSAQIDRLPPRGRRLLRVGAVLGSSFSRALFEAIVGEEGDTDGAMSIADLDEFIEPEGGDRLRFRQRLVRDVAYASLPFRRRRELHARAGRAIEQSPGGSDNAEVLSLHFLAAQHHEAAWHYGVVAGDRAKAKYANVDAAELYGRALSAAGHLGDLVAPSELAAVWEALGDVRHLAGVYEEAAAAYRSTRRLLADEPAALGRLFLKQAKVAERQGRYSGSVRWVRRGLRLLEHLDDPDAAAQRARLGVWYATIRQRQGRHREAIRWCHRAVGEASTAGDRRAVAEAYRVLDWAYMDLGRADLATNSATALVIYEELGDLVGQGEVLNNLGGFAYYQGRWEEALELYARSDDVKRRTGNVVDAAAATANRAEILADQGRLDEAEAAFSEALRVWRSVGYPRWVAFATMHLGRVMSRRGRFDEAMRLLKDARDTFLAIEAASEALEVEVWIAECLLLARDTAAALAVTDVALQREAAMGGSGVQRATLHRIRGYALAQMDDVTGAWAALDESLAAGRERGAAYEIALTLEALAVVALLAGRRYEPSEEEHRLVLRRLGVTRMPTVPMRITSA